MKYTVSDSTLILTFEEDLLSTDVKKLLTEVQALLESSDGLKSVHADIRNCRQIDSKGFHFLVDVNQECQSRDWEFQVVGANLKHTRLFEMVKLTELFELNV